MESVGHIYDRGRTDANSVQRARTDEGSGGVSGTEGLALAKAARSQRRTGAGCTAANPDSRRDR